MAESDDHMIEITSTDLTKALEDKAFEEAEKLIKENRDPSYLNKGAYGALPLTLVLSGEAGYRNLYLAQLLVKQGADVNPYLPRQMADATPLEYVVNLYLDMKALSEGHTSAEDNSSVPTIIGLHREQNPPPNVIKDQCWELIELLVAYGADPGVILNPRVPPVFHTVVADKEPDIDLVMKLYEAGGDFNREDIHGNTPLMDYIAIADRDSALPLFEQVLSLVPELRLDHKNCNDETVLWRAMLAGSPRIAVNLIRRGAGLTDQAIILPKCGASLTVSPIFAPLIQNSVLNMDVHGNISLQQFFSVTQLNKVMSCSVFPVVDCTDICGSIISELETLLSSRTRFPMEELISNEINREDVAVLMLGYVKCGLQQLCVRKIVEQLVNHELPDVQRKVEETENWDEDLFNYSEGLGKEAVLVTKLNKSAIESVVKDHLKLPVSLVPRFMIEAARLQLATFLFSAESPDCVLGCDRDSDPLGYSPSDAGDYEYGDYGPDDDYGEYDGEDFNYYSDDDDDDDDDHWDGY
ncbi:uncharacterized protein [Anabrus simplex]|uniref:uncharacterized protein isoform X1 n=1 Tax=Anabrus simplex TaxID=316456 RepID=UPI0035A388F3